MSCKKENCKCYKCGKIADKEVDTKLLSNSSTSDLKTELVSNNETKAPSNVSSETKSNFVVYKQDYPSTQISRNSIMSDINSVKGKATRIENEPLSRMDEEPVQDDFEKFKQLLPEKNEDDEKKIDSVKPPEPLNTRIEEQDIEVQTKEKTGDENTSPINSVLGELTKSSQSTRNENPPTDLIPPICSVNNKLQYVEDDVPVRKFSISMREDMDKPLHPIQHHDSNGDLSNSPSSDEEYSGSPEKGFLNNIQQLKTALQVIVDTSDKILNTINNAGEKLQSNVKEGKEDNDDENKKKGDSGKGDACIFNVHSIQLDSRNPVTINFPLQINFRNNGNINVTHKKPTEVKPTSVDNHVKTSSESVNIHYPKSPYKTLSSEFVITEKVLVNGYTDGIPRKSEEISSSKLMTKAPTERIPTQISDLDLNQIDVINNRKKISLNNHEVLSDKKVNLKLPVNFPQQRNIKVCVPCYCDACPLFDDEGNVNCPEKCGCCTCAYTINEANPEDRTELELCRCTSKTQFNIIGRSYVSRCQCSRRVDLCPCRDKYGSLGEQVAEFDDDTLVAIKKRKSTQKSTLRTSRLSMPLLQLTDDSANNDNTTTTSTTPTTDDTGRMVGDDKDDRGRVSKNKR